MVILGMGLFTEAPFPCLAALAVGFGAGMYVSSLSNHHKTSEETVEKCEAPWRGSDEENKSMNGTSNSGYTPGPTDDVDHRRRSSRRWSSVPTMDATLPVLESFDEKDKAATFDVSSFGSQNRQLSPVARMRPK